MARRNPRPAAARKPTVVSLGLYEALKQDRDRLAQALQALKAASRAEADRLTSRVAELEKCYAATLPLRAEYERVVKERDDARRDRDTEAALREDMIAERLTLLTKTQTLERSLAEADFATRCARADADRARRALAEQAMTATDLVDDLRHNRRFAARLDITNPRNEAASREVVAMGATYAGPMAAPYGG